MIGEVSSPPETKSELLIAPRCSRRPDRTPRCAGMHKCCGRRDAGSDRRHGRLQAPALLSRALLRAPAQQAPRRLPLSVPGHLRLAVRFVETRSASCLAVVCIRTAHAAFACQFTLTRCARARSLAAKLHNASYARVAAQPFVRSRSPHTRHYAKCPQVLPAPLLCAAPAAHWLAVRALLRAVPGLLVGRVLRVVMRASLSANSNSKRLKKRPQRRRNANPQS